MNVEAITSAMERRGEMTKDLHNFHVEIEEKSLRAKKESLVKRNN